MVTTDGRARLSIKDLQPPSPWPRVERLVLDCESGEWSSEGFRCKRGTVHLDAAGLGAASGAATFVVGAEGESVEIGPLAIAGGRLTLSASREGERWKTRIRADGIALRTLPALASVLPGGIAIGGGSADVDLEVAGAGDRTGHGRAEIAIAGLAFSDPAGLRAADGVALHLHAGLEAGGRLKIDATAGGGELFVDPVFVSFAETPLTVSAEGELDQAAQRTSLDRITVEQRGVATLRGHVEVGADGVERGDLAVETTALAPIFEHYVLPLLAGTEFAKVAARGRVAASLGIDHGQLAQVDVDAEAVEIDDGDGRVELHDGSAKIRWRSEGHAPPSTFAAGGGRVLRLPFGPFQGTAVAVGHRFTLAAPLAVPVLDGGIDIDVLDVDGIGTGAAHWSVSGRLRPVSLERLGAAFGWPPFGGTLAFSTPRVTVRGDEIVIDGTLTAEVFGGEIALTGVRVVAPFGVVPRFGADAVIRDLDLDLLTRAFSFGRIEGRLGGQVTGLVLERWRPTAFDLRLATPKGDDSRHRISQRAVDNLASIGGAGAALSSTFMRLFREFSYRRLGISCRLAHGVCTMDGVAPASDGFYIVEGGGLPPRIDVVGYNRKVDWDTLVERLRAVTTANAPVVR